MIFRTRSRWVIALTWLLVAANVRAPADVVWTGLGVNSNWTISANWQGGVAPFNDGTDQIYFGDATRTSVVVNTPQSVRRMRFDFSAGTARSYSLAGLTGATLTLGADGIEVISAVATSTAVNTTSVASNSATVIGGKVSFAGSLPLVLGVSQSWVVGANSSLEVSGPISGSGRLTLTGGGYVELSGNNTYTGGTELAGGAVAVEHNAALGTGAVTVDGPAAIYSTSGIRTLTNALNLNSTLLDLLPYGGEFRLTGPVTLGASTTLRNYGQPVYINGSIAETGGARSLTVSGLGAIVLSGNNTYSGGSVVTSGALFFSNASSVPATGALSNSAQGYIGTGFNTGVQAGFIGKFSGVNTLGTIGFDTSPGATSAVVFAEPIDLSPFNAFARLGSATRATLSAAALITPANAAGYRFGGGGGTLKVESRLTGANALTVDSSSSGLSLTLLVNGTNNYTGLTTVTGSALVFGPGAVSLGSAAGSFVLGNGGYIGSSDANLSLPGWLGNFSPATVTGVIGFDRDSASTARTVTGNFDLAAFTGGTSLALGTSSAATLVGSISLPAGQSNYIFTGYKGGWLTVDLVLSGARGLQIGHALGDYPEFDPNDPARISTVFLNGSNSHTAGTTFFSGRLVLGQTSSLGTGTLTVDGSGANVLPRLETSMTTNPAFTNQLVVKDDFEIGGINAFTWAGNVSDGVSTGTLRKFGAFNLTLSGNNAAFSGGFQIDDGTVTFATDNAAGTGGLDLGSGGGTAAFTTAAPTLTRLIGASASSRLTLASGTTLTVNQASDSTFRGQIQGAGAIAKAGAGVLRLETAGTFSGGTAIRAGTIDVATTGALGTSAVTLNGATSNLKLGSGVTLANSIVFGPSGGRLSGHGAFSSSVILGTNSVVSPGSSVGTLTFTNGLTLASGGSYDFEMQNALGGAGAGWDFVQVTGPLTFTAAPTAPFTLNLISLNSSGTSGAPANFLSGNAYSWQIASATSIVGFDPAAVNLNSASFTAALNGGAFNLSTSGGNVLLNFTPVPEPSTWALLLAGFGVVAVQKLRRRR